MRGQSRHCLALAGALALAGCADAPSYVRRINIGHPTGSFALVRGYEEALFVVYPSGKRDVSKLQSMAFPPGTDSLVFPFPLTCIDPVSERKMYEDDMGTRHLMPTPISAQRNHRSDEWMSSFYEDWVLAPDGIHAYAVRSDHWFGRARRQLCRVDVRKRKGEAKVELSFSTMAIRPDGETLFLTSSGAGKDPYLGEPAPAIICVSLPELQTTTIISLDTQREPHAMAVTSDGHLLFCATDAEVFFINAQKNRVIGNVAASSSTNQLFCKGDSIAAAGLALSSDEQEIYVGTSKASRAKDGAVVAIDISRKQVIRRLQLSDTGCTSVAIAKGKLFAACLDGLYVIDIDKWRKQGK